jgi:predicted acetyltransferase
MAGQEGLTLVDPIAQYKDSFLRLVADFESAGEKTFEKVAALMRMNFAAYVRGLENAAKGIDLPKGFVPYNTYWLVRDGRDVVGVSHFRHHLTPKLRVEGGHIGYSVAPSERRKGYGTRILALTLERVWVFGLTRVMVTCDTDNVASAKIIERNGGQLARYTISERSGKQVSVYWITLT